MSTEQLSSGLSPSLPEDRDFDGYLERIRTRFLKNVNEGATPVFSTSAGNLFPIYLANLPAANRQYHTCHACRHFMERYGNLVTIDEKGHKHSAVWSLEDAPEYYKPAVRAMLTSIAESRVTGVFLSELNVWGTAFNVDTKTLITWSHFAVMPHAKMVVNPRLLNAGQLMAAKLEDYRTLTRALSEFGLEHLEQAVTLLKTEALYRSEKVLGVAEFLLDLKQQRIAARGSEAQNNVVWAAVAKAPPGFCTPRSSMIGTLLEDLEAGLTFETVKRRFTEKMSPLQYQRPQAAPKQGAIDAAEKLVEKLGIARSLERRYARLDDVLDAVWRRPAPDAPKGTGGVFKDVVAKGKSKHLTSPLIGDGGVMTWVKFRDTVLPHAERIEARVPSHGNYLAMVTAVHADAPPILQWDHDERRNPVSWYVHASGSSAADWHLKAGSYVEVPLITLQPSLWFDAEKYKHHGNSVIFLLEGAWPRDPAGVCLFPELLKSELHGARSTIEAFSLKTQMQGAKEATAVGLRLGDSRRGIDAVELRVTIRGTALTYKLDRWD